MNDSTSTDNTSQAGRHTSQTGVPSPAYEEMVELIASGATPQNLIAFRPSEASVERVRDLLKREKSVGLSADETSELEHYVQLEHIMRLVKARAQRHAGTLPDSMEERKMEERKMEERKMEEHEAGMQDREAS